MAKKTTQTTYVVAHNGLITVKNFEPRTFGDALAGNLKKGWKKDPSKLAAAVRENADLLTAAAGLIGAAQEILGKELDKLSDQINGIYETAINDNDRDFTEKEIKLLDKLEPNADRLSEDLEDMVTLAPADWLELASKKSYKIIVKVFEEFFALPVVDGWECFSPAIDTPEGRAAHELRGLGLCAVEDFELDFNYTTEIAPASVKTSYTIEELNTAAEQGGYAIRFVEPIVPQRTADMEEEKPKKKPAPKKAPAAKKAVKTPAEAPKTLPAPAKEAEEKKAPAAKPATRRTPAKKPAATAKKAAAEPVAAAPQEKKPAATPTAKPVDAAKPAAVPAAKPAAAAKA